MAKRKGKRKKKRGRPQAKPSGPKTAAPREGASTDGPQAYQERKLRQAIAAGDESTALSLLEQRFGGQDARSLIERLEWLLSVWPARGLSELRSAPAEVRASQEMAALVASQALIWPDDVTTALLKGDEPWVGELRAVLRAARLITEERDDEARRALKSIGLRSPFRHARLLLRALMDLYAGRDERARAACQRIPATSGYHTAARNVLAAAGEPPGDDTNLAWTRRLTGRVGQERAELTRIRALARSGRLNSILRQAGRTRDPALSRFLRRELIGLLAARRMDPREASARVGKAVGRSAEDPAGHCLTALLCEAVTDLEWAEQAWKAYAGQVNASRVPFSGVSAAEVSAAVQEHRAELLLKIAELEETGGGGFRDPFDDYGRYLSPPPEELQAEALELLRAAVELDDSDPERWLKLLALTQELCKRSVADQLLERMVKRFPDQPTSLRAAAWACYERKAFDKALRHATRAAELEPLNRDTRDLQATMLLAKGRKKSREGKVEVAAELYRSATEVPQLTPSGALKVFGEAAAFASTQQDPEGAAALEERVLSVHPSPWVFRGYFYLGWYHLNVRSHRGRQRARYCRAPEPLPDITETPTAADLQSVLGLRSSCLKLLKAVPHGIMPLIRALAQHVGPELQDVDELAELINLLPEREDAAVRMALAERGLELAPGKPFFVYSRYEAALDQRLPKRFFRNAGMELSDARHAVRPPSFTSPDYREALEVFRREARFFNGHPDHMMQTLIWQIEGWQRRR